MIGPRYSGEPELRSRQFEYRLERRGVEEILADMIFTGRQSEDLGPIGPRVYPIGYKTKGPMGPKV